MNEAVNTTADKEAPGETHGGSAILLKNFDALFPSPVFTYELPGYGDLNRALLADIESYRSASEGINRSNHKGWHSDPDVFLRREASFRLLGDCVAKIIFAASSHVSPGLDTSAYQLRMNAWINVNPRGAFNVPHDHHGEMWSGCYYVRVPSTSAERSGDIEFLDPRGSGVERWSVPGSRHFRSRARTTPEAGQVLLFPSYLRHWVYPNDEEEERVSIAFNANLIAKAKKKGDMAGDAPDPV